MPDTHECSTIGPPIMASRHFLDCHSLICARWHTCKVPPESRRLVVGCIQNICYRDLPHTPQHQLLPLSNPGDKACLGLDHYVILTTDMQTQSVMDVFRTQGQLCGSRLWIRFLHVMEADHESMPSQVSSQRPSPDQSCWEWTNNEWVLRAWHV